MNNNSTFHSERMSGNFKSYQVETIKKVSWNSKTSKTLS